eukprot:12580-Heterococcus_DN1.PRE.1
MSKLKAYQAEIISLPVARHWPTAPADEHDHHHPSYYASRLCGSAVHARLLVLAPILQQASSLQCTRQGSAGTMTIASAVPSRSIRAIDSHLHVWSNGEPPFPFADGKDPPASLRHCSRAEDLLDSMATAGVAGALIVQPINHLYDH